MGEVKEIKEGATNPTIPFVGQMGLSVATVVSLFIGFGLIGVLKPAGENAADWVSAKISQMTGVNPQTGQTSAGGAFD